MTWLGVPVAATVAITTSQAGGWGHAHAGTPGGLILTTGCLAAAIAGSRRNRRLARPWQTTSGEATSVQLNPLFYGLIWAIGFGGAAGSIAFGLAALLGWGAIFVATQVIADPEEARDDAPRQPGGSPDPRRLGGLPGGAANTPGRVTRPGRLRRVDPGRAAVEAVR